MPVAPSPAARHLFSKMVVLSDDNLYLNLEATLGLAVDLVRSGHKPLHSVEVAELVAEGWIDEASNGGWLLH